MITTGWWKAALSAIALGLVLPRLAAAQDGARPARWAESTTRHFAILAEPGAEAARDHYTARADGTYEALAALFGATLDTPITLRLFASSDGYRAAHPLSVVVDDLVVRGRRGRREIDLAPLPAAPAGQVGDPATQAGLDNALRRELAHLFATRLSDDRLPAGFREGIALYLEQPGESRAPGVARLRGAWQEDRLPSWSDVSAPGAVYADPAIMLPQTLSIVHFLVAARGFPKLLDFARASATAPGWRNALETTYARPPVALEADWRAWLPSYLDGGWRQHALYVRDLAPAEALLGRGDYAAAEAQLTGALALLGGTDPAGAEGARALLARAASGRVARARVDAARAALAAGDYGTASVEAAAARGDLAALGDADGARLAGEVAERAGIGVVATAALARSERLPAWRMVEARHAAYQAAEGFGRVGNDVAAARARARVAALDDRLAPAGWGLSLLGAGLLGWNARRRRLDGRAAVGARP